MYVRLLQIPFSFYVLPLFIPHQHRNFICVLGYGERPSHVIEFLQYELLPYYCFFPPLFCRNANVIGLVSLTYTSIRNMRKFLLCSQWPSRLLFAFYDNESCIFFCLQPLSSLRYPCHIFTVIRVLFQILLGIPKIFGGFYYQQRILHSVLRREKKLN